MDWTPVRHGGPGRTPVVPRIEKLEKQFASLDEYCGMLDADLAKCRRMVHHLYQELSCKPPAGMNLPTNPECVELINGRPRETA